MKKTYAFGLFLIVFLACVSWAARAQDQEGDDESDSKDDAEADPEKKQGDDDADGKEQGRGQTRPTRKKGR